MEEFSKVGERVILNLHLPISIANQIPIDIQVVFQADQERSKGLRHGKNNQLPFFLFFPSLIYRRSISMKNVQNLPVAQAPIDPGGKLEILLSYQS